MKRTGLLESALEFTLNLEVRLSTFAVSAALQEVPSPAPMDRDLHNLPVPSPASGVA